MNPKHPLDAGLAERLERIWIRKRNPTYRRIYKLVRESQDFSVAFEAVAAEVRRIVKEAKEGE